MQQASGLRRTDLHVRRQQRTTVRARAAHLRDLSRLRQAVAESVSSAEPSLEAVEANLGRLKQQWATADSAPTNKKAKSTQLGKGVRRIGHVTEYDFTVIDADGDDPAYDFDEEDDRGGGFDEKQVPREAKYFDTAQINVRSGDGGDGCCAFLREKFVAHGGPAGGNGGSGGSVWVVADEGLNSLARFRNQVHWKADGGTRGQGKTQHGANARDKFIRVPVGTIVRKKDAEDDTKPPIAELLTHGEKALVVLGGNGGRGNASFKTSQNKAPTLAETGEAGTEMWLQLELKLVADAGIIGVPNAGKSTLLSRLSSAKPKIANYSFTTLVPNLGVCELDYQTTVFADVPGLIEGASDGRGLGHEFLRHVSRAHTLVHVLDGTSRDPIYDYKAIRVELELYGMGLTEKPQIVAYNKVDVPDSGDYVDEVRQLLQDECGVRPDAIMPISAVSGQGVKELPDYPSMQVRAVRKMLEEAPESSGQRDTAALNVQFKAKSSTDAARLTDYTIEADLAAERTWYVSGVALERFAQMTNWRYFEASLRFQRVLKRIGLWTDLESKGVKDGDTIVIGESAFVWSSDQDEQKLFDAWSSSVPATVRGSARWPRASA